MKTRKDLEKLRFTVVAEVNDDMEKAYHVSYTVYTAHYFDDVTPISWVPKEDCNGRTDKLEEAEVFLHGDVKWDGCSNWWFDVEDEIALHCCERWEIARVSEAMLFCYDWTKELLPKFEV